MPLTQQEWQTVFPEATGHDQQRTSLFDQFLFALLYVHDERAKDTPNPTVVDCWWDRAQELFLEAVQDEVKRQLESLKARIVIEEPPE